MIVKVAAVSLLSILFLCTLAESGDSEYHTGSRRSVLQSGKPTESAAGCLPGLFSAASGCAGCDGVKGWCPDGSGKACTRDCGASAERNAATAQALAPGPLALHVLCGNKAVLARNSTAPVFGTGQPGDKVAVVLKDDSTVVAEGTAVVGSDGMWVAPLGSLTAGSGYTLTASVAARSQDVTSTDVAVGELWLIAGQSNVGITLDQLTRTNEISFPPFTTMAKRVIAETTSKPDLHLFKVPMATSATPVTSLPAATKWFINDKSFASSFGAFGFVGFADLASRLGVHVGVVQADVGGTSIVQWLPKDVLATIKRPATPRDAPSDNIYNAMIKPLQGAAWSGAVWFQGESDAGLNDASPLYRFYSPLLTALLSSWRKTFSQPKLPWQIVQLPGYNSAYRSKYNIDGQSGDPLNRNHWPYVRASQRRVANADPLASLVPGFDLGLSGRIHPPNKFLLGNRLAQGILKQETGSAKYNATGPDFVSAVYSPSDIMVTFNSVAEGLIIAIKQPFSVTLIDRKPSTFNIDCLEVQFGSEWIKAKGNLAGSDSIKVQWEGREGMKPTNVRYGWFDLAVCNLYNERELPAIPFTSVANPFA